MANKRGDIRKRTDPIAIATKGRQTTYEFETQNVAGVPTRTKVDGKPIKLKIRNKNTSGKTYTVNYTLDTDTYPGSRNDLTFDISTGVTNAT